MREVQTCSAMVWDGFHRFVCQNRAKVERDGKHWCGRHDPAKREAKRAERELEFKARIAAAARKEAERAEVQRRADCFDDLLEALQLIVDLSSTEWQSEDGKRHAAVGNDGKRFHFITSDTLDAARDAIRKATGEAE